MIRKFIEDMRLVNKENGLVQLFVTYIIMGSIIVSMTCNYDHIKQFGIFFIVILGPLFITQTADKILYREFIDGFLELRLTVSSQFKIILEKYLTLSGLYIISYFFILPLMLLFFNLDCSEIILISRLMIINIIMAVVISLLIGCCNCYFKKITLINFIINIPLILPNLIITGLIITNNYDVEQLFMVLYGIGLIIVPIIFYCSSFLIKHIYDI